MTGLTTDTSIMPPGMPHIVITIGMAMFAGNHFYTWHAMARTVFSIYDTVILGNLTNDANDNSWEVLRRMGLDFVAHLEARLAVGGRFNDAEKEAECTYIFVLLCLTFLPSFCARLSQLPSTGVIQ
jgi:hypothetical protein